MDGVELTVGDRAYRWEERHFELPTGAGWAHDGVAVLHDGSIVTSLIDRAGLTTFGSDGRLVQSVETDLTVMHDITVVEDEGQERLWVADPGARSIPDTPSYGGLNRPGRAVLLGIDGRVVRELSQPEHPAYAQAGWKPCSITADEARLGGTGNVWVADGYGQSLVHCYDASGKHLFTLDGETTGARFNTPHGILIDRRGMTPEVLVADRGNRRLVVFDLDGGFRRVVGADVLTSPSALTLSSDALIIAELHGRLAFYGPGDSFAGVLGENDLHEEAGWPNALDDSGAVVPRAVQPGLFNSPHGVAADSDGNLYVNEWLIGGRLIRLVRQ